jgi:secreted trypsin-like serine protease
MSVRRRRRAAPARATVGPAVVALCLLAVAPAAAAVPRLAPRIVNGTSATIAEVPFQVALYDPEVVKDAKDVAEAQFCGGVIIDAMHVLTAAHCVTLSDFSAAPPREIAVLAGSANLEEVKAPAVEDPVARTSFDPAWNAETGEHDIGVLTLEQPLWEGAAPGIDGASPIAPIEFASEADAAPGSDATISGWGYTRPVEPEQELDEEEARTGFLPELMKAKVSLVSRDECSTDYKGELVLPKAEFLCAIGGAGPETTDSCFGDSGGPLFSGTPGEEADRLLGTVDLGLGCAQPRFPGVYQSLLTGSANARFATSKPPQAPISTAAPSITGDPAPGETVTCRAGSWLGESLTFHYEFFRDQAGSVAALTPLTERATYPVQPSDSGTRIFCGVLAVNDGGIGEALSADVTVAGAVAVAPPSAPAPGASPSAPAPGASPAPSPAPATPKADGPPASPRLRVVWKRCRRSRCSVDVVVSVGAGAAAVTQVQAKLTFKRRYRCRRHRRRATCTRTVRRWLEAKAIPGEHFVIVTPRLAPGRYALTLSAIDRAGVRQARSTPVVLTVKRPRGRSAGR